VNRGGTEQINRVKEENALPERRIFWLTTAVFPIPNHDETHQREGGQRQARSGSMDNIVAFPPKPRSPNEVIQAGVELEFLKIQIEAGGDVSNQFQAKKRREQQRVESQRHRSKPKAFPPAQATQKQGQGQQRHQLHRNGRSPT